MKKKAFSVQKGVFRILLYAVCAVVTVLAVFPFAFVVLTSVKSQKDYFKHPWQLPEILYWGNFSRVLQKSFLIYFRNSILVCVISVVLIILCTSMVSYAITKIHFRGANLLFGLILIGMMIPVHTTLIPIYVMSKQLGLYNHLIALIGPYVSFAIPVSTVIITQFFREVPREIEEAATIDGCGHFTMYACMMMPLAKPAISTVVIYNILQTWNEFIYSMTLIDSKMRKTLPVGLKDFYGESAVDIPAIMCAVLVSSLPVIIAYFLAQEQVVNGLTQGAVKG